MDTIKAGLAASEMRMRVSCRSNRDSLKRERKAVAESLYFARNDKSGSRDERCPGIRAPALVSNL